MMFPAGTVTGDGAPRPERRRFAEASRAAAPGAQAQVAGPREREAHLGAELGGGSRGWKDKRRQLGWSGCERLGLGYVCIRTILTYVYVLACMYVSSGVFNPHKMLGNSKTGCLLCLHPLRGPHQAGAAGGG